MHVPLVVVGPGTAAAVDDEPVSTRRVFHTILEWAGLEQPTGSTSRLAEQACRAVAWRRRKPWRRRRVVLGEAMKPFLGYGWQPQIMAIEGRQKAILAGKTEVYDVIADPGEAKNLGAGANLSPALRKALDDYPVPVARGRPGAGEPLGRGAAQPGEPRLRQREHAAGGAQGRAAAGRHGGALRHAREGLRTLRRRSGTRRSIPLLEKILAADPYNLDAALRLATAYSSLGQDAKALAAFKRAATIAPRSPDVRTYLALHYARGKDWPQAVPLLERIVAETPERLPAVEALAVVRERQGQDCGCDRAAAADRARCARRRPRTRYDWGSWRCRRSRRRWRSSRSRARDRRWARLHARPRTRRAVSVGAPVHRRAERARSRPAVTSGVSDGALQARAGERPAQGTRQRGAHRPRASARGPHDARAHREGEAVSVSQGTIWRDDTKS